MPEPVFKLTQLNGQGRRRNVQGFGCPREMASVGNHPKVAQVVEVKVSHFCKFNLIKLFV
jgi:hypothetical protein